MEQHLCGFPVGPQANAEGSGGDLKLSGSEASVSLLV